MLSKDERWSEGKGQSFLYLFLFRPSFLLLSLLFSANSALADQVNINTALEEELTSLPYIGPARARAIITHRQEHGPFGQPEDLIGVESIGPESVEAIRPHIITSGLEAPDASTPQGLASGEIMLLADEHYFPVLINFIKTASLRIDVVMYLFKTTSSKHNKAAQLINELVKASQRGVPVQVVLEKSAYNESLNQENERVAAMLQTEKIKVRFDSPSRTTHSKMIIIDNRFCFVGSHNLSHSALALNHEISLLLDNRKMAAKLTDYIDSIK